MSWNTDWFLLLNVPALPGAAPLLTARLLAGLPPVLAPRVEFPRLPPGTLPRNRR
jgi:hypothetical protein